MIEAKRIELSDLPRKGPSGHRVTLLRSVALERQLEGIFGRKNLCLKLFKRPAMMPLEEFCWGPHDLKTRSLVERVRLQNLCAMCGLAPRVYAVVRIDWQGQEHFAQVTDFLRGAKSQLPEISFTVLRDRFGLHLNRWDGSSQPSNFIGGKLIDFESLVFVEEGYDQELRNLPIQIELVDHGEEYKEKLVERALRGRRRAYQPVPELGIPGRRNLEHRMEKMRLGEIDFEGKTVLDFGCSLGAFSREAHDRGAKRVVGIDSITAGWAHEIANWLGYWNLDFFDVILPHQQEKIAELSGIGSFDIVFLLAMFRRVGGWAPWLSKLCKGVLYVESHVTRDTEEKTTGLKRILEKEFQEVEYLGEITDDRTRVLLRCRR